MLDRHRQEQKVMRRPMLQKLTVPCLPQNGEETISPLKSAFARMLGIQLSNITGLSRVCDAGLL